MFYRLYDGSNTISSRKQGDVQKYSDFDSRTSTRAFLALRPQFCLCLTIKTVSEKKESCSPRISAIGPGFNRAQSEAEVLNLSSHGRVSEPLDKNIVCGRLRVACRQRIQEIEKKAEGIAGMDL
jgi:hypothetical protein